MSNQSRDAWELEWVGPVHQNAGAGVEELTGFEEVEADEVDLNPKKILLATFKEF